MVAIQDTWPTSAWGALANASVGLRTSLPTNAWWENIVLGFPSQVCIISVCLVHVDTFERDAGFSCPMFRPHLTSGLVLHLCIHVLGCPCALHDILLYYAAKAA